MKMSTNLFTAVIALNILYICHWYVVKNSQLNIYNLESIFFSNNITLSFLQRPNNTRHKMHVARKSMWQFQLYRLAHERWNISRERSVHTILSIGGIHLFVHQSQEGSTWRQRCRETAKGRNVAMIRSQLIFSTIHQMWYIHCIFFA
jgi:hypothetical protein